MKRQGRSKIDLGWMGHHVGIADKYNPYLVCSTVCCVAKESLGCPFAIPCDPLGSRS